MERDSSIEPALTAEEWEHSEFSRGELRRQHLLFGYISEEGREFRMGWDAEPFHPVPAETIPALIALANAALPDGDKRKITREVVAMLRNAGAPMNPLNDPYESDPESPYASALRALADALESYLPPP